MPSFLAACLLVAFILWLLYRNTRERTGLSLALWVPIIWVGIIESRPVGMWLSGGQHTGGVEFSSDGSLVDGGVFLLLIVLGVRVLMGRNLCWNNVTSGNRWFWILCLYWFISVTWSVLPFVALKRWIKDLGNVVMILIILSEADPVAATREVFVRCGYVLIPLSVLFIKYYINIGRYYNDWTGEACLKGVTDGKNQLGRLAMVTGIFLIWKFLEADRDLGWAKRILNGWPEGVVLAMCIWILFTANSATSFVCFALGFAVLMAARADWIIRRPQFAALTAFCFVIVPILFFSFPGLRASVTTALGRKPDLTERTDVWEGCLKLNTGPLIGAGFASVWLTRGGIELGRELNVGEAHNGYLETYLNGGFIGLGLLLAMLFSAGLRILREVVAKSGGAPLFAAVFLAGLVYNFAEATFNNNNVVGFLLWLVVMGCMSCQMETRARGVIACSTVEA